MTYFEKDKWQHLAYNRLLLMQPVRFEVIKLGGSSLQESKHKKQLILTLFAAVKIDKYFTGYQYYT